MSASAPSLLVLQYAPTALLTLATLSPLSQMIANDTETTWPASWISHAVEMPSPFAEELADTHWIWLPHDRRHQPHRMANEALAAFRRSVPVANAETLSSARLLLTADSSYTLYLNGTQIARGDHWRNVTEIDLKPLLASGENLLAVRVENLGDQHENLSGGVNSPAGLLAKLSLGATDGTSRTIQTDSAWRVNDKEPKNWTSPSFDDSDWATVQESSVRGLEDWTGNDAYSNRWYCYRKTFHLDSVEQELMARIAVDSKYWLWINGELAVFEGGAKRGPDPDNTYYDTIDLAPFLKVGSNQVAILAWYWGRSGFSHNDSGHHALYFDLKADGSWIVSDNTWKSADHHAYGNSGSPHPNYRLPEYNVHFDARLDFGEWTSPDFNDSSWRSAFEIAHVPDAPWNQLVDRLIPQWSNSGLISYENQIQLPSTSKGEVIEMDLPYNAQVTPYFEIKATAGQLIDLRMDNYVGGSEQSIRSEYVTKDGIQSFETLAWMNGHKVEYRFPKGIEILDLKYRETAFDAPVLGSFKCDDPFLNELWQRSLRTLLVCMRDTYYDCPDRERAQWWGDAVIEIGQTFYALDRVSDTLSKKAIRELVDWQRPDATLFSPVPAGKWNAELPGQMLMSIGRFGFWLYYEFSGDEESIRYAYPSIRPYLELWRLDEEGLVENRQGDWYWGDWGTNKDTRILDNCYYYLALDGAKRIAELLGETQDTEFYEARMRSIGVNFDRVFWQGDKYRSPEYEGEIDDRGHGLAVLAGLASPDNHDAIAHVLENEHQASPYVEKYILEALFQMGLPEQALARMKQRYRTHLEVPVTTLFEGWGIGSEGFGGGTINHSWSGGPLTLLSQYVAGISPILPGFKAFRVEPQLGSLQTVEAKVPTVHGLIEFRIDASSEQIVQRLTVPDGTAVELVVKAPLDNEHEVYVNDKPLGETEVEDGVVAFDKQADRWVLTLCSGKYTVTSKAEPDERTQQGSDLLRQP